MDNQHRRIKGYRELDKGHVHLMNKLKLVEAEFLKVIKEVAVFQLDIIEEYDKSNPSQVIEGYTRKELRELAFRNMSLAKTHIEDATMRAVRAVALPLPLATGG